MPHINLAVALAASRFQLRPVRRILTPQRPSRDQRTWGVCLGPETVSGHEITLRSPRLEDADEWRELRMRDQARIEPWWASSELPWAERHTTSSWVSHCLQVRRAARAGRCLPLVVEVDGRLAGECSLEWISPHTSSAELGGWLGSTAQTGRISVVGLAMLIDYAVLNLGLRRLTAPVCVGNRPAALILRRIGLHHEGVMAGFLDVGGARADHHLYAITADRVPMEGLLAGLRGATGASPTSRRPRHELDRAR